jgi:hypothetical protein
LEAGRAAFAAGDKFANRYAQFIRSEANARVMTQHMEQQNLDARSVADYVRAFETLAPLGKLALNPSAIGTGVETEVYDVSKHHNYHLLTQPHRRPSEIDKLSASEYFELHPELQSNKLSPDSLIARRIDVASATAKHFEQANTGKAEGQVVKETNMGGKNYSGYPKEGDKYSFKAKVRSNDRDRSGPAVSVEPGLQEGVG